MARLESTKQAQRKWQFSGSSPFWTTCQSCGLYPAARAYYAGPDKRWACQACQLRKKGSPSPGPNSPENFEEIGKSASPKSYMALVYVDLDRLGKYMDHFGVTEADGGFGCVGSEVVR
jgi:CRISPR/Cas system-associated protein Cas10 (large subunit of type III CRISPR-Cas system)